MKIEMRCERKWGIRDGSKVFDLSNWYHLRGRGTLEGEQDGTEKDRGLNPEILHP